jgi:hypothetical protein
MDKKPRFEGGPIFLNSGGQGPDDYLLRKIGTRKWFKVIFRFGRNFGAEITDGKVSKRIVRPNTLSSTLAQSIAHADRNAMDHIFPILQIDVSTCGAKERMLRESGKLVTMTAEDFLGAFRD